MCFSASVSFTTGALLVPLGAYQLSKITTNNKQLIPFAAFPLLFGLQQLFEGVLWLGLDGLLPQLITASALGFLLFAFLIWPVMAPYAAWLPEPDKLRRHVILGFMIIGIILGGLLYLPLLFDSGRLSPEILQNSISYRSALLLDGLIPREMNCGIYTVLVTVPLFISSYPAVRLYGLLILLSVIISAFFFHYAFTSVWCFFAAILSLYTMRLLRIIPDRQ